MSIFLIIGWVFVARTVLDVVTLFFEPSGTRLILSF